MHSRLPDQLDLWRSAAAGASFCGELRIAELPRLCQAVHVPRGMVRFSLKLGRDTEGRVILSGALQAVLILECQRCLRPMELPMTIELNMALVSGAGEAGALPERYEPLYIENRLIRPLELIEDELLLALPLIPRHGAMNCVNPALLEDSSPRGEQAPNPFAALADWKARQTMEP